MDDNEKLIRQCQKRSKKAFDELYKTYSPIIFGICLRYTRNKTEAEDLLQNCFLKILNKIDDYEFKGSFEGWMRKIFVNEALMALRKNDALRYADKIDNIPAAFMMESREDAVSRMGAKELTALIESMPPGYRAVFNLTIDGFQHDEIARMLGISSASSRSQLSRAREWLQKRIEELY